MYEISQLTRTPDIKHQKSNQSHKADFFLSCIKHLCLLHHSKQIEIVH